MISMDRLGISQNSAMAPSTMLITIRDGRKRLIQLFWRAGAGSGGMAGVGEATGAAVVVVTCRRSSSG